MASPNDPPLTEQPPSSFTDTNNNNTSPTPSHQPTPPTHRTTFDFFTLNTDGSTPDLIETHPPPGQRTPPAALSSLAVRMADRNLTDSTASFDTEQYDMVDDVSEVSNDDNETVSIESTDEDDGQMTPDETETGSLIDAEEAADMPAADNGDVLDTFDFDAFLNKQEEPRMNQVDPQMQADLLEWRNDQRLLVARLQRNQLKHQEDISTLRSKYGGAESFQRQAEEGNSRARSSRVEEDYSTYLLLIELQKKVERVIEIEARPESLRSTRKPALVEYEEQLKLFYRRENLTLLETSRNVPSTTSGNHVVQNHQMQPMSAKVEPHMLPPNHSDFRSLEIQQFQVQLMILEQSNKKRLLMARQESDRMTKFGEQETRAKQLEETKRAREIEADHMLMSEDLETPRQSTYQKQSPPADNCLDRDGVSSGCRKYYKLFAPAGRWIALFLVAYFAIWPAISSMLPLQVQDLASRREALSNALVKMTNNPDATKSFNIEQLVPSPTPISTNIYGGQIFGHDQVRYQGVPPNTIIVSLPWSSSTKPNPIKAVEVHKSGLPIPSNTTHLLDTIWAVTFDPAEAHGILTATFTFQNRGPNITLSHNFGRRFFLPALPNPTRPTLPTALVRQSAKSLSQHFHLDLSTARNASSHLALHISRDLQLWAHTTASRVRNSTLLRPDLSNAREEIAQVGKSLQTLVARTTDLIRFPLARSHERAAVLREKLKMRKERRKVGDLAERSGSSGWFGEGDGVAAEEGLVGGKGKGGAMGKGCGCGGACGGACACKGKGKGKCEGKGKGCGCGNGKAKGKGSGKVGGCACAAGARAGQRAKTRPTVGLELV